MALYECLKDIIDIYQRQPDFTQAKTARRVDGVTFDNTQVPRLGVIFESRLAYNTAEVSIINFEEQGLKTWTNYFNWDTRRTPTEWFSSRITINSNNKIHYAVGTSDTVTEVYLCMFWY